MTEDIYRSFFCFCFLSSVKTVDGGLIKIACQAQFPISGGQQPVVKLPLNSLEWNTCSSNSSPILKE